MNLRRISENLDRFKKMKAERTQNSKWKSKKVYVSELQPRPEEWPDVYEVIVSETLLCQHEFDRANESNCAKAFSVMEESDKTHPLTEAFQVSVGNGDPDESNEEFTSLFDLMRTPPVMDSD